jgi:hypothetical protein
MACPPSPQPPNVFMNFFPSTLSQWLMLLISYCGLLLLLLAILFRLTRFLRPLPSRSEQRVLLALAGVGLLGLVGFLFCFLWTLRWRQALDNWLLQLGDWVRQDCFPHGSIPYTQVLFSGDWVFYLEWVFLIFGVSLYLLVRWRAEYLIRRREQQAFDSVARTSRKRS